MGDNNQNDSLEPIVVTESLDPDLLNTNPKKNKKWFGLFLLLLMMVGVCGFIQYYKNYIDVSPKTEEKEPNEEPETTEYSLDKLKKIDQNQSINYFSYDAMHKDYLEMDESNNLTNKIEVNESLKSILKVDKNKLYWYRDGKWIQDEKITDNIEYFISDFNIESGYKGIIVIAGLKLYAIDNPNVPYDGFATEEETKKWATNWISNIKYKELELPGAIQNFQITYGYACEGWIEYKLLIDNELYYLTLNNKKELSLVKASDYVNVFTNLVSGCGYAPKGLLADGTIKSLNNKSGEKISVKHYIIFGNTIMLIDKDNYLYLTKEIDVVSNKEINLTPEDKVKSVQFKTDENGNGNSALEIILSDDTKLLFDEINTSHY